MVLLQSNATSKGNQCLCILMSARFYCIGDLIVYQTYMRMSEENHSLTLSAPVEMEIPEWAIGPKCITQMDKLRSVTMPD